MGAFEIMEPSLKKAAYERLVGSVDPLVSETAAETQTNYQPGILKDWTDLLHSSVDGAGLRETCQDGGGQWLDSGTRLMKVGTYVQALKIRLGVLNTPARSVRGLQRIDHLSGPCDFGCGVPGTVHHILQVCPHTQP